MTVYMFFAAALYLAAAMFLSFRKTRHETACILLSIAFYSAVLSAAFLVFRTVLFQCAVDGIPFEMSSIRWEQYPAAFSFFTCFLGISAYAVEGRIDQMWCLFTLPGTAVIIFIIMTLTHACTAHGAAYAITLIPQASALSVMCGLFIPVIALMASQEKQEDLI